MSQENSALSCATLLAEDSLLRWASDMPMAARSPWLCREANPTNRRRKVAKKYATVTRLVGEVNSNIGRRLFESTKCCESWSFISADLMFRPESTGIARRYSLAIHNIHY